MQKETGEINFTNILFNPIDMKYIICILKTGEINH